jgi:DNA/RNA-binding domain of Phe-tRNA-synthetase-like protein
MPIEVDNRIGPTLLPGVVEVEDIRQGQATPELRERCAELAARVIAAGRTPEGGSAWIPEDERRSVRQLLKGDGFSPTGRNRPAPELLCNMVLEQGSFPHISHAVDVNNLLSIQYHVPISLLDAGKVGPKLILRWGQPEEGYVFNQAGHRLGVKHCLVACSTAEGEIDGVALGSPIKDSMAGKVFQGCTRVVAVIYAPAATWTTEWPEFLRDEFANLLTM